MDNQKSNEGSGRNVGSEGSGNSMGKDQNTGSKGLGASDSRSASDSKSTIQNAHDSKNSSDSKSSSDTKASSDSKPAADLYKTIDKTIDKAADAAKPMAERLATTAHESVDKVQNALSDASGRMDEKTRQLTEAYKNFADTGREYVRSSPATSVLVALAAGYTLSKLFGSRRH